MHRLGYFFSLTTFFVAFNVAHSKVNHVSLPQGTRCSATQYFDTAGLECVECDIGDNPTMMEPDLSIRDAYGNALECTCSPTKSKRLNTCSMQQLQIGTCAEFSCSSTCNGLRQAVSLDGISCVPCGGSSGAGSGTAVYDDSIQDCSCGNPPKGEATATPVSTRRLVEIYDAGTALPVRKDCYECPFGTAVISDALYEEGDSFYATAGKRFQADPHTCVSCTDPNMFFDTDYNCVCKDGYTMVGESAVGEQHCIQHIPSISSDYSKARFNAIRTSSGAMMNEKTTVDSIMFSHYYLKAASECEFLRGVTVEGFASCQVVGNLCVLNLYDDKSAPCQQFQKIIAKNREWRYHGQEDWKYALPWLYYSDEADDISTDRGINMRVSFSERPEHTHILKFKLAKYALDGTFMGLEDLTTQFSDCLSRQNGLQSENSKFGKSFTFGHSERFEYTCNLKMLLGMEMYFYDMFLVDEASSSCGDSEENKECLYPVPVLHRNFVKDGLFPNMNINREEEYNDRYSRRFFLFDNVSGRSSSGVEVLRYAKTIVLQTSIQSEDPNKIYPPQLMIEYVERYTNQLNGLSSDDKESTDELVFKMEYTMNTRNFWNAIEISIGFVSAIAGVVWIFRVYNWQNRNHRPMEDVIHDTSYTNFCTTNFIHVIMLACHTFVIVFAPFIFFICGYWFVFFKLQEEVFVMLPANNEFYGLESEYQLFYFFFHALFWSQTIYLGYVIYKQSKSDVFFVDWEKPKSRGGIVSIWRTVLVANEWNEMQTTRKTSIEFSLAWIGFFMIGMNLYNNATTQPNLNDHSDGYINIALRFANIVWWWSVVSLAQWVWNFTFYERYCSEPQSQIFLDLCTVAKISIFLMDGPYHGYYLHCRSPYELADCSMVELTEQLEKEESGFTTDRGLDVPGAPRDCQVFELFTSRMFRNRFDKVYNCLHHRNNNTFEGPGRRFRGVMSRLREKEWSPSSESITHAMMELNGFLQCFIDQSPPPMRDGLRYVVREPSAAERILGMAPADIRAKDCKCIFYPDQITWIRDHGYLKVTFLGIELDLLVHDILTFNIADLVFNNPAMSILITYLMHLLRVFIRSRFGKKNIAKKTFVDDRFLV